MFTYIPVNISYHYPYMYWSTFLQQLETEPKSIPLFYDSNKQAKLIKEHGMNKFAIGGHKLPPLPYSYDALEPFIDSKTMRLHHLQHHQEHVDGLNKAELALEIARVNNDYSLIKYWQKELAYHGAGHILHTAFWRNMSPHGGGLPDDEISAEIVATFGSFSSFKKHFSTVAEMVEGSGWAMWVYVPLSGRTEILQIEKHQNLSLQDLVPLLLLDVWEHAYYLKYQSKRNEYINSWWNVVNWTDVKNRFLNACKIQY